MAGYVHSKESKSKCSITMQKLWSNSKYKAKNSKGRSKRAKQVWADPMLS